jgi:hypothetical protein
MIIRGKDRRSKEIVYSGLQCIYDYSPTPLAASIANTVVQQRFPLGFDCKVGRVTVVLGGTAAGTCSFNIVVGEGAETGATVNDTSDYDKGGSWTYNTTSGTPLFAADQVLTMTVGLVQTFTPAMPDAIFQQGTELTLRLATNGSATASENVTVLLWGIPVDTHPQRPMSGATSGTAPAPWSWANNI